MVTRVSCAPHVLRWLSHSISAMCILIWSSRAQMGSRAPQPKITSFVISFPRNLLRCCVAMASICFDCEASPTMSYRRMKKLGTLSASRARYLRDSAVAVCVTRPPALLRGCQEISETFRFGTSCKHLRLRCRRPRQMLTSGRNQAAVGQRPQES
jgi:hypothetical protein